ncbi:MAG: MobF family relaxase [Pseudomonadota bacterium]
MLSITKINSASNQSKKRANGKGYLHYLGGPTTTTRQRGDFDDYARGKEDMGQPAPFWACKGAALLGLDAIAEADHVERLAKGFHPITGVPLVKGAGDGHVMGLDMTFSAPKDVSAVFAGADRATRDAVVECVQQAAKTALDYAEANTITRHGHGGKIKQIASAAIAACYTHFSSRAGEPQLHIHGFLFNLGQRRESPEWSALEQRSQFERKLATGILFRVELASRLRGLGFTVEPAGPYFTIRGIDDSQRLALSTRSQQIAEYMRECGMLEADGAMAKEIAALNTRSAKAEPSLNELLGSFEKMAADLGLTPESIAAMRATPAPTPDETPFTVDHGAVLEELMESQSCATAQEALALICQKAMGRWNAAECLEELDRFLANANVIALGHTEHLTQIFTSKATQDMEAAISDTVAAGASDTKHRVGTHLVDVEFDRLEAELRSKLGVDVSLAQQRAAALHIASQTGRHAFVEGWAGTGKTTMLKALGVAYKAAGFEVLGCCQSAAASQNLARETNIPSRTIASLLLSLQSGRAKLGPRTILVLDEAGMVGSREFALLQDAAMKAGAKLVAVGDAKQLQPIDAGGIFRSLMERHGKAEISNIQRQRTDFEPLLRWLVERKSLDAVKARALRGAPEEARLQALEALCAGDGKLRRAFGRWQSRYDFEWMREAVELFATGEAKSALKLVDAKGRLKLISGHTATLNKLISDWSADKTPIAHKTMIAGTRAEVAELNARARASLVDKGLVDDAIGMDIEITHRDETTDIRRFAPGDRIVFTMNDKPLGVANGVAGSLLAIERREFTDLLVVQLDAPNERGEDVVRVPLSFSRFDHAYCLTNHKSQGRTFDAAYVLANPAMADREWTYVAASRSRFATTIYANLGALGVADQESHAAQEDKPTTRDTAIEALSVRMRRSRAKGTSLDYEDTPDISMDAPTEMLRCDASANSAKRRASATIERIKEFGAAVTDRARHGFATSIRPMPESKPELKPETAPGLAAKPTTPKGMPSEPMRAPEQVRER